MRLKINNEELFFNAFPFENSYFFNFWIGLDVVRSTGNLSNTIKFSLNLSVGVSKLHVAILARSSQEISQTVRID